MNKLKLLLFKTFSLIIYGFDQKLRASAQNEKVFPYNPVFVHGMNLWLAACVRFAELRPEQMPWDHESAFIEELMLKPVALWFKDWPEDLLCREGIKDSALYHMGPLAYELSPAHYELSIEAYDFLYDFSQGSRDVIGNVEEKEIYSVLRKMNQEDYVTARKALIEHPYLSSEELPELKEILAETDGGVDLFNRAYTMATQPSKLCPECGRPMLVRKDNYLCRLCSMTVSKSDALRLQELETTAEAYWQLRFGAARYIGKPGRLELQIADFCAKNKLSYELWPQHDLFDIKIVFPGGSVWQIDAKDYRSPYLLRDKLEQDGGLPPGDYERAFVVTASYQGKPKDFEKIVSTALRNNPQASCVSFPQLKKEIRKQLKKEASHP